MKSITLLPLALSLITSSVNASHNHQHRISTRHRHKASVEKRKEIDLLQSRNVTERSDGSDLQKRAFNGVGTYYYTDVGLGACGQWSPNDKWSVALNSAQYGGGYPGPQCFKNICIQSNGKTLCGIPILDECPTCAWGYLDLSPGLFNQWASPDAGVINIEWWFEGDSPAPSSSAAPPPTSTWTPEPSTSTSTWVAPTSTSTSTSTSHWVAPSSSSTTPSSSSTSTTTSSTRSINPFAVLSSVSGSSSSASSASASASSTSASVSVSVDPSASASASASASGVSTTDADPSEGEALILQSNLEAINGLVTNYGQIMVVAAGAA